MANENVYSARAKQYVSGRPAYAPQAIEKIFNKLMPAGGCAADIGSGTGILSKEFLLRGYNVYCVEPNEAMRNAAEELYGRDPHFRSVSATAENTGLHDQSVSLVTAASAFHWFDTRKFHDECRRILKPDGIVCIIINARIYDGFTLKQAELCRKYCPSFTSFVHGTEKTLADAADFFKGEYVEEHYDFPLLYTKEKFISRSLSSSYAPEKGSGQYEEYISALRNLLDTEFPEENIRIANETVMLWGRPREPYN